VIFFLAIVGFVTGVGSFIILCNEFAPLLRWMDMHHGGWKEEVSDKPK
jgi:hypothetical protein